MLYNRLDPLGGGITPEIQHLTAKMLLLIDNYDSFTYNLFHFLGELGADVRVERNDALTRRSGARAGAAGHRAVAGSLHAERGRHLPGADRKGERPGPDPGRLSGPSGHRPGLWRHASCARPSRCTASSPACITPASRCFAVSNNDFNATRYHSLTIAPDSMPDDAGSHRHQRGRRHPGRDAQVSSRAWRAVPSRKHRLRKRSRLARQFPRSSRDERYLRSQARGRACP